MEHGEDIAPTSIISVYKDFLRKWDLEFLLPRFDECQIDDDLFFDLTEEQITELLPTYALGVRWKLMKNIKLYKEEIKSTKSDVSLIQSSASTVVSSISSNTIKEYSSKSLTFSANSGDKEDIEYLDLAHYLKNHHDGKCLLKIYDINKTFTDDERNLLVDVLAKLILFYTTRPAKADYIAVQAKILLLFPSEERIYYIPPKEEGPHQRLARGKLFDKVRNLKEWMKIKGLLPRKNESLTSVVDQPLAPVPGSEEKDALEWLKYNREPWAEVEKNWHLTCSYRLAELKTTSELQEYLKKIKVLTQSLGYTLITSDFNQLYPEKENALFSAWTTFKEKILVLLKDVKKDPFLVNLKAELNDTSSEDTKDAVVIQSLPSFITPNRKVKIGKVVKKPSINESRDSFMLYVTTPTDLESTINQRKQLISTYGKGATVQPFIALVGESRTNISSAYVCINNITYKLDNIINALDVCFKCFFVLDLEYPVQSEQVWLTIQKVLYDITLPNKDKRIFNVSTFINKLATVTA